MEHSYSFYEPNNVHNKVIIANSKANSFKGKEAFCFGLQGVWILIVVLVGNSIIYIYIYESRTTCKMRFSIINILDCEQLETKSETWTTQIHNWTN